MSMLSYRGQLTNIGVGPHVSVSYKQFCSKPQSLRQAVQSMDAPASQDWSQVSDIFRNDSWTDEVQGVAWDGSHWIFSTNANQSKPFANDKAIYVFNGGQSLGDDKWLSMIKYKDVPGTKESDDHWGQLCYYKGFVYVSHFWADGPKKGGSNVVVFKDNDGFLHYDHWIPLDQIESKKVEFQAINPWDGHLYTCFGSGVIREFFMHDIAGQYTGKAIKFDVPVSQVQGACFSPNGHLYIATNETLSGDYYHQPIWYYSALNGHRLGVIPVRADSVYLDQELEGICFGEVSFSDGRTAQIHAILLENKVPALDNIFFKSFSSAEPNLV
jgi:hypothetical protein